jgi:hypothetical protein
MTRLMRVISILLLLLISIPAVAAAGAQDNSPIEVKSDSIGSFFGTAPFDPLQGSHKQTWNGKMWEDYGNSMVQEWKDQQWSRAPVTNLNPFADAKDLGGEMKTINEWKIKAYKMSLKKLEEERNAHQRGKIGYTEANIELNLAQAQAFNGYNEDALDSINKAVADSKKEYNNNRQTVSALEMKTGLLTTMGRTSEAAQAQAELNQQKAMIPPPPVMNNDDEGLPLSPLIPVIGMLCTAYIFTRKTNR